MRKRFQMKIGIIIYPGNDEILHSYSPQKKKKRAKAPAQTSLAETEKRRSPNPNPITKQWSIFTIWKTMPNKVFAITSSSSGHHTV